MLLVIFLVFLLCGPPFGWIVLMFETAISVLLGLLPLSTQAGPWRVPTFQNTVAFMSLSYVFGGMQAFLTGSAAMTSFVFTDHVRVSLSTVLVAAGISGLLFAWLLGGPDIWFQMPGTGGALMVVHLGAAFGCWIVVTTLMNLRCRPLLLRPIMTRGPRRHAPTSSSIFRL